MVAKGENTHRGKLRTSPVSLKEKIRPEENQPLATIENNLEKKERGKKITAKSQKLLDKVKAEDVEKINQNLDKMKRGAMRKYGRKFKVWPP